MAHDLNDRVVLGLVLENEPAHLSTDELGRELAAPRRLCASRMPWRRSQPCP